jgi:Fur family transcriptional regulator, stress-responsive regulator
MIPTDVSEQLRLAGLRVTVPRQSVPQWLAEHPHAAAEQVRSGVTQQLGTVPTQAVYDVPAACTRAGLVRRIEPAGYPALVCRTCGRTEDVDCAVDTRPCLTPEKDRSFAVDEAEVVFWVLCPACTSGQRKIKDAKTNHHHNQEARQ